MCLRSLYNRDRFKIVGCPCFGRQHPTSPVQFVPNPDKNPHSDVVTQCLKHLKRGPTTEEVSSFGE